MNRHAELLLAAAGAAPLGLFAMPISRFTDIWPEGDARTTGAAGTAMACR